MMMVLVMVPVEAMAAISLTPNLVNNVRNATIPAVQPTPLSEVVPVPATGVNATPSYTFSSTTIGTLTFSGGCTSTQTFVSVGSNTIKFSQLALGTYANCSLIFHNPRNNYTYAPLVVRTFTIKTPDVVLPVTAPGGGGGAGTSRTPAGGGGGPQVVLTEVTAVPTPGTDTTPSYTFRSTKSTTYASVKYTGKCTSSQTGVVLGINTITFATLAPGNYSDCLITYYDPRTTESFAPLKVSPFTILTSRTPPPTTTTTPTNTTTTTTTTTTPPPADNTTTTPPPVDTTTTVTPPPDTTTPPPDTTVIPPPADTTTTTTTLPTGEVVLLPSPDILSCRASAKTLYFEEDQPAYDVIGMNCVLTQTAIVSVNIFDKSYDPKVADNSAGLIKKIKVAEILRPGKFFVSWDGFDDYDQAAVIGNYVFEVDAKTSRAYSPDISMQKFNIANAPAVVAEVLKPAAVVSECPGVNYPSDIGNSPVKDLIWKAYCLHFIEGYPDGTFRGKQDITRAEAVKVAVLAAGEVAKASCPTFNCNSPFLDLDMWQGPWLGTAWDLKMVVGVGPTQYAPNRGVTKAEAASLIVKALKIEPHVGCYDAGCGAGFPKDIFLDVIHMWEGPYLRALWDKKAVHSVKLHMFFPDMAITREQFVEILMRARA